MPLADKVRPSIYQVSSKTPAGYLTAKLAMTPKKLGDKTSKLGF